MSIKISRKIALSVALVCLCLVSISRADSEVNSTIERIHSEVDESSCICGLNRDILDRLEAIIRSSRKDDSVQCTLSASSSSSSNNRPSGNNGSSGSITASNGGSGSNGNGGSGGSENGSNEGGGHNESNNQRPSTMTTTNWAGQRPSGGSNSDRVPYQNYRPTGGGQSGAGFGGFGDFSQQQDGSGGQSNQGNGRPTQQFNNEFGLQLGRPQSGGQLRPTQASSSWSSNGNQQRPTSTGWFGGAGGDGQPSTGEYESYWQANYNDGKGPHQGSNHELSASNQQQRPVDSGFLQGIFGSDGASELAKLNQSQQINSSDIQSALESTIPNLVSNIFSNIQNITIQTENGGKYPAQGYSSNGQSNSSNGGANILTSIDGSSVQLLGNTTQQITAQGEELFMQWIEHQIHTLKLTASTANYIRKSALNLFRRIVKQYVERIERLGGRVEDNVRQATQVALYNTQNLIAYILRNYINFAGGLMQIIGESVSRFGKRIDSTGETIANVNLNPFDIVSDVIDSLPNPSHYSEYFRAFGKYLMGESTSNSNNSDGNNSNASQEQQTTSVSVAQEKPKGLFSKAMGSLSKTLGAWIG